MSTEGGREGIALPEGSHQQKHGQKIQIWSQQIPECSTFPLLLPAGFGWLLGTRVCHKPEAAAPQQRAARPALGAAGNPAVAGYSERGHCWTRSSHSPAGGTSKEGPFLFLHVGGCRELSAALSGRCGAVCNASEKEHPVESKPVHLGTTGGAAGKRVRRGADLTAS